MLHLGPYFPFQVLEEQPRLHSIPYQILLVKLSSIHFYTECLIDRDFLIFVYLKQRNKIKEKKNC